jgi:HEPN domain-containing protein
MKNHDIAIEWFKMAEIDINSANFLLAMKPVPFEIICYHCQQCVEKYLKGFIALNGGQIPNYK